MFGHKNLQRKKQTNTLHTFSDNIALNRPANISSLMDGDTVGGNDGDIGTCAVTKAEPYPWWAIDLGARYVLKNVTVYTFFSGGKHPLIFIYIDQPKCRNSAM